MSLYGSATGHYLPDGTRLNNLYEIEGVVGEGGMGVVYRGRTIETGDPVAIKVIRSEMAGNESALALFRKEASVLNNLLHEAIVRYYVFTRDPEIDRPYLATEFVDGVSLADIIERHALSRSEVIELAIRLAEGLQAAHRLGVIHRDISPDNVILPDGDVKKAKIIDFGIARAANFGGKTVIGDSIAGKFDYMSPEQLGLFGANVTPRSDMYSLGVVLAEASLGQHLDMGGTQVEVIEKRRTVPKLDGIEPRLKALLTHMLQPKPGDRPETMTEIAATARSIAGEARSRLRRGPVIAGVAAVMVVVVVGGIYGLDALSGLGASDDGDEGMRQFHPAPLVPAQEALIPVEENLAVDPPNETAAASSLPTETETTVAADPLPDISVAGSDTVEDGVIRLGGGDEAAATGTPPPQDEPDTAAASPEVPATGEAPADVAPAPAAAEVPATDEAASATDDVAAAADEVDPTPAEGVASVDPPAPPGAGEAGGDDRIAAEPAPTEQTATPLDDGQEAQDSATAQVGTGATADPGTDPRTELASVTPTEGAGEGAQAPPAAANGAGAAAGAPPAQPDNAQAGIADQSVEAPDVRVTDDGEIELTMRDPADEVQPVIVPPASTAEDGVRRYIARYDAGPCTYIRPMDLRPGYAKIEAFGDEVPPFVEFDENFARSLGFEADIGLRLVKPTQCPAVEFVRQLKNNGAVPLGLRLDSDTIRSGFALTGTISGLGNRELVILVVNEDGRVYPIDAVSNRTGDSADIHTRISGGPQSLQPHLLLVLAADSMPDAATAQRRLAPEFFSELEASLGDRAADVRAQLAYFKFGG